MNKEEIDRLSKELAELHARLDKVIKQFEEESKEWKPKYNERYFFVNNANDIHSEDFQEDDYDYLIIKYNKVFPTEKEAQEYADYLKAIAERTYKFSKEEWEDAEIKKYYLVYDGDIKAIVCDYTFTWREFNKFTFKTKEEAQAFIDEFGDKILNYEF